MNVHHEVLIILQFVGVGVGVGQIGVVVGLVVDYEILDSVGGQVLKSHFGITLEEVLAVDEQFVDLAAVHLYHAVRRDRGARELAHEGVEHRAFAELEGSGVKHHRVALHHHLHARAGDGHFVELAGQLFLHPYGAEILGVFADGADAEGRRGRRISVLEQ